MTGSGLDHKAQKLRSLRAKSATTVTLRNSTKSTPLRCDLEEPSQSLLVLANRYAKGARLFRVWMRRSQMHMYLDVRELKVLSGRYLYNSEVSDERTDR